MHDRTARGVVAGVVDCLLYAAAALYWPLLQSSTEAEVLGHRLVWALLFMTVGVVVARRTRALRDLLHQPRKVLTLAGAALCITINWAGFIWGVNHGHVVDASLAFFISPLMTVLLGVVVLHEQVTRWQGVALGLALVAVLVVAVDSGRPPWYALVLAATAGTYGLLKKQADAGPYESLALETAFVAPIGLVALLVGAAAGHSTFATAGVGHALLLAGGGLVTVVPLVCYGYAATRVPLVTLGLVGYVAPLAIFALGVLHFGETIQPARWVGFALIWVALLVVARDTVRTLGVRSERPSRSASPVLPASSRGRGRVGPG